MIHMSNDTKVSNIFQWNIVKFLQMILDRYQLSNIIIITVITVITTFTVVV